MKNYFSHDSAARDDEKILALRMKHNWEGYGLYWALVEKLREATDYKLTTDYNLIAYDLRVSSAIIKSIITDFGLFAFSDDEEGKRFYSESLMRRMDIKDSKSKQARRAAQTRWKGKDNPSKEEVNADALQPNSDSNASKVKESKVKEIYLSNARESRLVFLSLIPLMEELLNDQSCIEDFQRTTGAPYPNAETISDKVKEFFAKLTVDGEETKERKDAIYHFKSWCRQQSEIDRAQKQKGGNNAIQNTRYNRKPANKTGMAGIKD